MAPRANWKGFLKVAELTCPVALYTAASTSERIAFHTLNRATGHRVRRQFIDQETGKPVEADAQVKGYEVGQDEYIVLEPAEIAAAIPESDKTLAIVAFIRCDAIDTIYFDRPYYLSRSVLRLLRGEDLELVSRGLGVSEPVDVMSGSDLTSVMTGGGQAEIRFLGIESSPAFVREPEGNGCAERFIRLPMAAPSWPCSAKSNCAMQTPATVLVSPHDILQYP